MTATRVARWLIFRPKIPFWVNFGMENVGLFYELLEYLTAIW
jgi:hypothetical protein